LQTADDGMRIGTAERSPGVAGPIDDDTTGRAPAGTPARRTFAVALGAITLAGLALRLTFTVVARGNQGLGQVTDNRWYYRAGRMLADGYGFGNPFIWEQQHHRYVPSAGHPPLYPMFLAAVNKVGVTTPLGDRLATCVLGALAVLVLGLAAREFAGPRAGLVAAGIAAVYPALWINDAALLSETPYVLLVALFLWSAIRCWRRPTYGRVLLMSLWVALASLTRSEAILLYPLAVLPLLLRVRGLSWRARFERVGAAAAVALVLIGPWVAYNQTRHFAHRVFIVSGSGIAMSYGNCDQTYSGQFLGYWFWDCGVSRVPNNTDETVQDAQGRKQALHYMRTHLREQPKVIAARVGRLFQVYRPRQSIVLDRYFERRGLWPSRLALWMYYPVTILAIAGAVVLWRRRLPIVTFVGVTITAIVAAASTFGVTRYRAAFDAAAVVLAGVAIDAGLRWWRRGGAHRRAGTTPPPPAPPTVPTPQGTAP
jgi:4-amino-4-deoxy-L-arabinose transferase-like glycosyltransferase